ncbi:zincin-like metallopeptidase domain-containing protein [Janthinobacterium sp. RB2R34]|uniref:zincin-like metallopeptidase domain-containing protein n=1 Tax=Janthinobacterium sp. RB2R34 TaxID=3424193 RepID=UPI003F29B718
MPALDEIRLPAKKSFHSAYDYYATAMHEGAHSTAHKRRLDRREAIAKRWGDEELTCAWRFSGWVSRSVRATVV